MTYARLCASLAAILLLAIMAAIILGPTAWAERLIHDEAGSRAIAIVILTEVRLPRIVAAALIGAALGGSGAAMQGLMRNPLAEPGVMGVSACAALAATATIYFGFAAQSPILVPFSSLVGALIGTTIILASGLLTRQVSSVILFGVALSSIAGAIMALFVNLAPNPFSLSDLINWTAGSVANRDWVDIAISVPFMIVGVLLLFASRRSLSALAFGEEAAFGLGVDLWRTRILVILGTGLATGGAVALGGIVGFVGLVAPHMIRRMTANDAGQMLVPAAMTGAILLVMADCAIRMFPYGNELHLGTLAALIGAPVFAMIAMKIGRSPDG